MSVSKLMTEFKRGDKVWVTLRRHDPVAQWWKAEIVMVYEGNPRHYSVKITQPVTLEAADHIVDREPKILPDGWWKEPRPDGL